MPLAEVVPASQQPTTPRGAGLSGKGKGPEIFRALLYGGAGGRRTLHITANKINNLATLIEINGTPKRHTIFDGTRFRPHFTLEPASANTDESPNRVHQIFAVTPLGCMQPRISVLAQIPEKKGAMGLNLGIRQDGCARSPMASRRQPRRTARRRFVSLRPQQARQRDS